MANPFRAHFDSKCQSCGEDMRKGTLIYVAGDNFFLCKDCATEGGYVCGCGQGIRGNFSQCYSCARKPILAHW